MESDLHVQYVKIRTYTETIRTVTDMTDRYEMPVSPLYTQENATLRI